MYFKTRKSNNLKVKTFLFTIYSRTQLNFTNLFTLKTQLVVKMDHRRFVLTKRKEKKNTKNKKKVSSVYDYI